MAPRHSLRLFTWTALSAALGLAAGLALDLGLDQGLQGTRDAPTQPASSVATVLPQPPLAQMPRQFGPATDSLAGILDWTLSEYDGATLLIKIEDLASDWSQSHPLEALAHADLIEDPVTRALFRRAVLGQLADQDPLGAIALINELDYRDGAMVLSRAIAALARTDPIAALEAIRQLPWGHPRNQAFNELLSPDDPERLRRLASYLSEATGDDMERMRQAFAERYASLAPKEALTWAEALEGERGALWHQVLWELTGHAPDLALPLVEGLAESPRRTMLLTSLVDGYARSDPWLAAALVDELPPGANRHHALWTITEQLFENDRLAALAWIDQRPLREREALYSNLSYSVSQEWTELAMRQTDRVPPAVRGAWITHLVNQLLGEGRAVEAMNWVDEYAGMGGYGHWMGTLALSMADGDPVAALQHIAEISDGSAYLDAQTLVLESWSQLDPLAAARWLAGQAPDQRSEQALVATAQRWYYTDPQGAMDWAMTLERSGERDAVLDGWLVEMVTDPIEAQALIQQISDPQARSSAQSRYLRWLADYDAEAARLLLEQSDLDPSLRRAVEEAIGTPGG